jgi:transglycosylase-like protein
LPDLLRRVAALTAISVIGIVLLAPMAVRSAIAEPTRTQALLDAASTSRAAALPRSALIGRDAPAALSLAMPGFGAGAPEALSPGSALPTPAVAPMEATLFPLSAPRRAVAVDTATFVVDDATWDLLAMCESSGNWAANTGNGYYGGLQFGLATWRGYGGAEFAAYPHQATREQQIAIAERLHAARGFQPWPACRAELGLP